MIYVMQRHDGQYVRRPGSEHSYTRYLQYARTWPNRELAERERCGNERILTMDQAMRDGEATASASSR